MSLTNAFFLFAFVQLCFAVESGRIERSGDLVTDFEGPGFGDNIFAFTVGDSDPDEAGDGDEHRIPLVDDIGEDLIEEYQVAVEEPELKEGKPAIIEDETLTQKYIDELQKDFDSISLNCKDSKQLFEKLAKLELIERREENKQLELPVLEIVPKAIKESKNTKKKHGVSAFRYDDTEQLSAEEAVSRALARNDNVFTEEGLTEEKIKFERSNEPKPKVKETLEPIKKLKAKVIGEGAEDLPVNAMTSIEVTPNPPSAPKDFESDKKITPVYTDGPFRYNKDGHYFTPEIIDF